MNIKILVIDDDKKILKLIKEFLEIEKYRVYTAQNIEIALELLNVEPDLIILDIGLPGMDGISFCKKIRSIINVPIIFLSARIEESTKIMGLRAGGDDYIIKPFSLGELLARIEAHIRRENRNRKKTRGYFDLDLLVDQEKKEAFWNENRIKFTKTEFAIVELLSDHEGQVFDRERIYEKVQGFDKEGDNKMITELIRRIRKKLGIYTEHEYIKTVRGYGYRWNGKK